jgi:hypothetical protein
LPAADAPNAFGCGRDGSDFSGPLSGEAQCCVRPQPMPDLSQCADERSGKRINQRRSSSRTDAVVRVDFQDAMAKGLGVTEYDQQGRAAQEIEALWSWTRAQFEGTPSEMLVDNHPSRQAAA